MGRRRASWKFGARKHDTGRTFLLLTAHLELCVVLVRIEMRFTLLCYVFSPPAFVIVPRRIFSLTYLLLMDPNVRACVESGPRVLRLMRRN